VIFSKKNGNTADYNENLLKMINEKIKLEYEDSDFEDYECTKQQERKESKNIAKNISKAILLHFEKLKNSDLSKICRFVEIEKDLVTQFIALRRDKIYGITTIR